MIEVVAVGNKELLGGSHCNGCGDGSPSIKLEIGLHNMRSIIPLCDDCATSLGLQIDDLLFAIQESPDDEGDENDIIYSDPEAVLEEMNEDDSVALPAENNPVEC